jgi:hypothetical protein
MARRTRAVRCLRRSAVSEQGMHAQKGVSWLLLDCGHPALRGFAASFAVRAAPAAQCTSKEVTRSPQASESFASQLVIPAKAGIQLCRRVTKSWIPAFAGMTHYIDYRFLKNDGNSDRREKREQHDPYATLPLKERAKARRQRPGSNFFNASTSSASFTGLVTYALAP